MEKILIVAPIRDRQITLQKYLESIEKLDYPKDKICLYFLLNDSTDLSREMLMDFYQKDKANGRVYSNIRIDVCNRGVPKDSRSAVRRKHIYAHLAILRNKILDYFLSTDCTHLFSIDSDITVNSECLSKLLVADKDIISAYICNEISGNTPRGNALDFIETNQKDEKGEPIFSIKHIITADLPTIFPCDVTGAVYLIKRKVIEAGVRYDSNNAGEDVPFCLQAKVKGFKAYCQKNLATHHMYKMI